MIFCLLAHLQYLKKHKINIMQTISFSILVNTCDKFEDCWEPFFKLFSFYWPDYKGKIYLNTEYKTYEYGNLDIISIKSCEIKQDAHKITWSECLKRSLEAIDSEIVLYMQDDYFLKDTVKSDLVEMYSGLMTENKEIDCLHLTDQAVIAAEKSKKFNGLYTVASNQNYLISCQAALWRKKTLLSYLRVYENAWQFEEFGSQRAAKQKHNFYVVDRNFVKFNKYEIIPYIFTGIIQGRWFEEVVPLFEKHNIQIDYSKRGFVNEAPKKKLPSILTNHWKRIPVLIKNFFYNKKAFYFKD